MKANYGFDAPIVLRNLFLFSAASFLLTSLSFLIQSPLFFWLIFLYFLATALSLFATGCWMLYSMQVTKPKLVRRLIQDLKLKGNEKILDLGCGRGLMLIEAAKQVPKGKVYGIDLWTNDQSGNSRETTLQNAVLERVSERIELETGDFRSLPFADTTFDVVISGLAIHNVREEKERERVLLEMLRVLKPGGQFALLDFHSVKQYLHFLSGFDSIAYSSEITLLSFKGIISFSNFCPA